MNITLNLTHKCNLRCKYCKLIHDEKTMPESIAIGAIKMAYSRDMHHVIGFYGGEPLVAKELMIDIVKKAEEMLPEGHEVHFNLTDNCTLLDEKMLNYLIRHRFHIAVSYDGESQDTNRPFSDGKPSSEIVETNLKNIACRRPKTLVMTTVTKDSCRTLKNTIERIHSLGFSKVSLNLNVHEKSWDYEILKEGLIEAVTTAKEYGVRIVQFEDFSNISKGNGRSICSAGFDDMCIDTDGTIYPCITFLGNTDYSIGNISDGIDEDRRFSMYNRSRILPTKCINCKNGRFCRRECICRRFRSSGGIDTFSDTECEIMRVFMEVYIEEYNVTDS